MTILISKNSSRNMHSIRIRNRNRNRTRNSNVKIIWAVKITVCVHSFSTDNNSVHINSNIRSNSMIESCSTSNITIHVNNKSMLSRCVNSNIKLWSNRSIDIQVDSGTGRTINIRRTSNDIITYVSRMTVIELWRFAIKRSRNITRKVNIIRV